MLSVSSIHENAPVPGAPVATLRRDTLPNAFLGERVRLSVGDVGWLVAETERRADGSAGTTFSIQTPDGNIASDEFGQRISPNADLESLGARVVSLILAAPLNAFDLDFMQGSPLSESDRITIRTALPEAADCIPTDTLRVFAPILIALSEAIIRERHGCQITVLAETEESLLVDGALYQADPGALVPA